jgi:signal transduction histidine kinase
MGLKSSMWTRVRASARRVPGLLWRGTGSGVLAIAVAVAYFLAARFSFFLKTKPDDVAAFWPAAGVAAGILVGLGPGARLPVAVGVIAASVPANLLGSWNLSTSLVFALCNTVQVLLMAGLIERYFGSAFSLDGLREVLGLAVAAIVGTAVAAIGGTVGIVLVEGSTASAMTIWNRWLTSNVPGIVAVAPLLIGLVSAVRHPPPRSEIVEGVVALAALIALSGLIVFLPREPWAVVALVALLFPLLLWLAARCRPVFSAAAAFIVAVTIVWTTTFSVGMFDERNFPIAERAPVAQASILAVSLCAIVLASLFSERRASEARLARSNMMLQQEQNNRLMNIDAITSAIAHEVRQPLSGVVTNASICLRMLANEPPNVEGARETARRALRDGNRVSDVIERLRALFGRKPVATESVDLNGLASEVIALSSDELQGNRVLLTADFDSNLPTVVGDHVQLQQVILNLLRNASQAMSMVQDRPRRLLIRTEREEDDRVRLTVQDVGVGFNPDAIDKLFQPFYTTKDDGMGMGLSISRSVIESHQGRLWATRNDGPGATFCFSIPCGQRGRADVRSAGAVKAGEESAQV